MACTLQSTTCRPCWRVPFQLCFLHTATALQKNEHKPSDLFYQINYRLSSSSQSVLILSLNFMKTTAIGACLVHLVQIKIIWGHPLDFFYFKMVAYAMRKVLTYGAYGSFLCSKINPLLSFKKQINPLGLVLEFKSKQVGFRFRHDFKSVPLGQY